jgi:hypothetical protein
MPEEAVKKVREAVRGVEDETRRLIEETRRTRRELTPRPIRRFLENRLKRRGR